MAKPGEFDTDQQKFLLSYVDVLPDELLMHPTELRIRVALLLVGNATQVPMTFRVETTQPSFLKPFPDYGTIDPQGGTYIVLQLLKVDRKRFVLRQDKMIIHIGLLPAGPDKSDPSIFWKAPLGPPPVQAHRTVLINYKWCDERHPKTPWSMIIQNDNPISPTEVALTEVMRNILAQSSTGKLNTSKEMLKFLRDYALEDSDSDDDDEEGKSSTPPSKVATSSRQAKTSTPKSADSKRKASNSTPKKATKKDMEGDEESDDGSSSP